MKQLLLITAALFLAGYSFSQSMETTVEYMKTQQPAAMIELPYKADVLEDALKDHFSKQGSKGNETKGFLVFRNAKLEKSGGTYYDVYFKTERRSRKDKDISTIYLTVGHPGENIAVRTAGDTYGLEEAKGFLNSFVPVVEAYNLELQIKDQEEVITKADKKYKGLVSDSVDLQKRKVNLEEKIVNNSKSQEEQRKEMEKQKGIMEALRQRRKS